MAGLRIMAADASQGTIQPLPKSRKVWAELAVPVFVVALSLYANLSFWVTRPADYRFFPPFEPNVNSNQNRHLGGEYFNIAQALAAGRGYADPFGDRTGPTAWMPPVLPSILASLLWVSRGNRDTVMGIVVACQDLVLIATGLLVLNLARQVTGLKKTAALIFLAGLLWNFRLCFQFTHDCWLALFTTDLLLVWLVCGSPLRSRRSAVCWGGFGGFCALTAPVTAFVWATASFAPPHARYKVSHMAAAALIATMVVSPWVVRNYFVFGRLIPVKSNLPFELYQSELLQENGVLAASSYKLHPYGRENAENLEYQDVGEAAYLEHKREQFWVAFRAAPLGFAKHVLNRGLAATLMYTPFDRAEAARHPARLWMSRMIHPMPFLSLLFIIATAARKRLSAAERVTVAVYILYLLPYVLVSYYERYAVPMIGIDALLVVWACDRARRIFWLPVGLFAQSKGRG